MMLTVKDADKYLRQYNKMCAAIAACEKIDECKDIADKSVAMAAYFQQANDEKARKMFLHVQLRAWRRLGEILTSMGIDDSSTMSDGRKVRQVFADDPTIMTLARSAAKFIWVLRVSQLSEHDFEYALERIVTGSLPDLLNHTPHAEVLKAKSVQELRQLSQKHAERSKEHPKECAELQAFIEEEMLDDEAYVDEDLQVDYESDLIMAGDEALKEIGLTLQRKDRLKMKEVVFLIREEVHSVMRQAAFDNRITMQEELRRGLKLWLETHGYEFPTGETEHD